MNSHDYIIKTITIGNAGSGKTTLLRKITEKAYPFDNSQTIGVDFFTIERVIKGYKTKLHIWDTAGHERYQNLVKTYFKNNAICYVIYDVCDIYSFNCVPMWIKTFKNNTSNLNAVIVLLANKIDDVNNRVVSYEDGKKLADENNAIYIEVSSKTSFNLEKLIIEPVEKLLELHKKNIITPSEINGFRVAVIENNIIINKSKLCCTIQ